MAASKIQGVWRRRQFQLQQELNQRRRDAARIIKQHFKQYLLKKRHRLMLRQYDASVRLNLTFKRFLARKAREKRFIEREEQRRLEEIAQAELLAKSESINEKSKMLNIVTELATESFERIISDGPAALMDWCIKVKLLQISGDGSYSMGYLLSKVLAAANDLCYDHEVDHSRKRSDNILKIMLEEMTPTIQQLETHIDSTSAFTNVWPLSLQDDKLSISMSANLDSVSNRLIELVMHWPSPQSMTDENDESLLVKISLTHRADKDSDIPSKELTLFLSDLIVEVRSVCLTPMKDPLSPFTPSLLNRSASKHSQRLFNFDDTDDIKDDQEQATLLVVFEAPQIEEPEVPVVEPPNYNTMAARIQVSLSDRFLSHYNAYVIVT
jgi:hypothetical protein